MPSKLGKYTLVRTLGSGANSRVKLAQDENGNYFAIKILKKADSERDRRILELVITEVQTMSQLNHSNMVNLIEYNREGIQTKADGRTKTVFYIVLELASGGELFDYVAQTGAFSEPVARYYFRSLIEGLDYIHKRGISHRDLKPENLLFDHDFNLKIADFGFAAPVVGKDQTWSLKTQLGTFGYMAPEIIYRQPYNGVAVDLFAAAVILFIMVARHPPFNKADPREDSFYKNLCLNRPDIFWKNHSMNKPKQMGYFSDSFKHLITFMLQLDPTHRLSLEEVKAHDWYNGPVPSDEEVKQEFKMRKQIIDQECRIQEQQKMQQRAAEMMNKKKYKGRVAGEQEVTRGDEIEPEQQQMKTSQENRVMDPYIQGCHKNTSLFTIMSPDTVYNSLLDFLERNGI